MYFSDNNNVMLNQALSINSNISTNVTELFGYVMIIPLSVISVCLNTENYPDI